MRPNECKTAKKLRITLCVLFPVIIMFLSLPFVGGTLSDGYYHFYTGIDLMFNLSAQTISFAKLGLVSLVFAVLPIIGCLTAAFDRYRIVKGIVGLFVSFLGIFCITFFLKTTISYGAVFSIIGYLVTFVVSMLLVLVKISENRELRENGENIKSAEYKKSGLKQEEGNRLEKRK